MHSHLYKKNEHDFVKSFPSQCAKVKQKLNIGGFLSLPAFGNVCRFHYMGIMKNGIINKTIIKGYLIVVGMFSVILIKILNVVYKCISLLLFSSCVPS